MKKVFFSFMIILMCCFSFAQTPQKMSYQAVIRDDFGELIQSHAVGMQISILQGSTEGTAVFVETQAATTDANGLVTIEIGGGTPITGTFAEIDWSTSTYFIKTETDPTGGETYSISGTSQILSVPYALYANNLNLKFNGRQTDIFIRNDGSLLVLPKISVEKPYSIVPTVTDADDNSYGTVKIGTQVWMAENLRTTKYNDNSDIPLEVDNSAWAAMTTPAYCWSNNEITNKETYGALYNWYTVNTNKLCPIGWHVPTHAELEILTTYLGSLASLRLCEAGTTHWQSRINEDVNNDSKFTALPGGYRDVGFSGFSGDTSERCFLWSSTENTEYSVLLYLEQGDFEVTSDYKHIGSSVRCLMD
jgi:uncharacterized protein (TIGR02145 family)